MLLRAIGRGKVRGSRGIGARSIGILRRKETKDYSLNSDAGKICTTDDDDWGRGNNKVGSGAQKYGNSAEVYRFINIVGKEEMEYNIEGFWNMQE